jgi:hypothetical protein
VVAIVRPAAEESFEDSSPPIVGVGASAGGLEALRSYAPACRDFADALLEQVYRVRFLGRVATLRHDQPTDEILYPPNLSAPVNRSTASFSHGAHVRHLFC